MDHALAPDESSSCGEKAFSPVEEAGVADGGDGDRHFLEQRGICPTVTT